MPTPFPSGLKRSASMIILKNQHAFLLLKRNKQPHIGKYVPVGGKLEPFEDPLTAALRELEEETGIRLDQLSYAGHLVETSPLTYNWQSNIYWAEIDHVTPPYCSEGILTWITYTDLPKIPTPRTDRYIFEFVLESRPFALNAIYNSEMELVTMTEEIRGEKLI
ncbi:MAG: NUDIX domain-containing protein [Saprospiraceae bacterium]|nr:NUDIX domain-containing protein [Saprospiraceae bacterium]